MILNLSTRMIFGKMTPYVIELHPEDCEDLDLQNDTWFNTKLHPWLYVRRDKECWIDDDYLRLL